MYYVYEELSNFFFRLLFGRLLFCTGEMIRFMIRMGRYRPQWHLYANTKKGDYTVFNHVSLWIGVGFWVIVFFLISRMG